jgi:hypothetical protein
LVLDDILKNTDGFLGQGCSFCLSDKSWWFSFAKILDFENNI